MKTRIEELREQLTAQNKGLHYLKQTHETECVEQLCAEIDALRARANTVADEILDEVEDRARGMCHTGKCEADYNGQVAGTLVTDSGAISGNAFDLRRLAEYRRFRIVAEGGRMVVGYWPENDPTRTAAV